jgi:hypothetical protein
VKKPSLECDKRFHTNFKKELARGTVTKVIIKKFKMPKLCAIDVQNLELNNTGLNIQLACSTNFRLDQ